MKTKHLPRQLSAMTVLLVLTLSILPVLPVLAADTGPRNAGAASSVNSGQAGAVWINTGNIIEAGWPYTTATISESGTTDYLFASSFGFDIPTGARIDGIEVAINRRAGKNLIRDNRVSLVKGGVVLAINKAYTATVWPTNPVPESRTYGGAADPWGTTWTAEEVNASDFGVVLSAINISELDTPLVAVDTIQVTVFYTPLPATTTTIDCGSGTAVTVYNSSLTCIATVTRSAGDSTPGGSVSWATDDSGSFSTSPCTLTGSGASAACLVTYTPGAVGDGLHRITATYAGDANFAGSSGVQDVTVEKAAPTLSIINSPVTYNSEQQSAEVASSVPGEVSNIQYTDEAGNPVAAPVNAGTYDVTADFVPTDIDNYETLVGAPAGSLVIQKAIPSLSITNSPVTYTGEAQLAVVVGSVPGSVSNMRYNGGTTVWARAGEYVITADFLPSDTANYVSLSGASAGTFVVQKDVPGLIIQNSPRTYTGRAQNASMMPFATATGDALPGRVYNVRYNGGTDAPVGAGVYEVIADFSPDDTNNYESLTSFAAGTFVIQKATPVLSIHNSPVIYNGQPQAVVINHPVSGVVSNILYDEDTNVPVNAGEYPITADFIPNDTKNYESLTGFGVGTFVIQKATPALSITNSPVTYDGQAHTANLHSSAPGSLGSVLYNGTADIPINAQIYAVTADFVPTDTYNYASLSAAPAGNFVITPRAITVTADAKTRVYGETDPALTYQFTPGVLVEGDRFTGSLSREMGENAGDYPVLQGTLALSDNYAVTYIGADLTITARPITVAADPQTKDYGEDDPNLSYQIASGSLAFEDDFTGSLTREAGEEVGKYAILHDELTLSNNYQVTYAGADLTITARPIRVAADPQTKVYGEIDPDLSYQITSGSLAFEDEFTGALIRELGEDAGTYAILLNPDDPLLSDSYDLTFEGADLTITPATPALSITNSPVTYNGEAQPAAVTSPVSGVVSDVRYDGDVTVPVNAGVYAITADFTSSDPNHLSLQDAVVGSFEILKARPSLSVTNSPRVYDGQPHEATVVGSPPGEVGNVRYDGDAADPVNAGTYAVTADFVPADRNNYETLLGAPAGSFVIEKAVPALSVISPPVVYDGKAHAAIVEGSVAGVLSQVLYNGEASLPVAPGVYAVTADFDPTDATNYASLSAAPAGDFTILAAGPALDLKKTAAEATFSYTGDAIHYSYKLTNIGDVPLEGPFSIQDDQVSVTCPETVSLAVQAALTCTAEYTITGEDIQAGKLTNKATGYGRYAGEEVLSNHVELTVVYKPAGVYIPLLFGAGQSR